MKTHFRKKRRDENGIDRRKAYYIVLDTETCNSYTDEDGKLHLEDSLVYDIGFAVVDKHGKVYESYSFVIYNVFFEMSDVMTSAYYFDKCGQYLQDIEDGCRQVVTFNTARKVLAEVAERYKVKAIMAHNAYFDYNSCNNTERYLTKSAFRYFYPYGIELWDTLSMARDTFGKEKQYRDWCIQNNYVTSRGAPRMTAEILYRYISGKDNFEESHTGLEDVMIEKEIFRYCLAKHKPMRKKLFNDT